MLELFLQPRGGYAIMNCASVQISFWVKRESGENPERSRRCKRETDPPKCHWAPKPGKAEKRIPREPEDLLAGIRTGATWRWLPGVLTVRQIRAVRVVVMQPVRLFILPDSL